MDKQKILSDYKKQEDKMLLAQILDKIEFSRQREKLEYTDFLDILIYIIYLRGIIYGLRMITGDIIHLLWIQRNHNI